MSNSLLSITLFAALATVSSAQVGQDLKTAGEKTTDAAKTGAQKTGHTVKKGATKSTHAVKTGVHKTATSVADKTSTH
jgi:hypothetical protein